MIYEEWGFTTSPFEQAPLPATELGYRLLIGRDAQLQQVMQRIQNAPKMPILEGANGIGKTSVVNVAAYKLYARHLASQGPLYVPCRSNFQLSADQSPSDFVDRVYMEIAQTLIERKNDFLKVNRAFDLKPLDRWLNKSERTTYQGTVYLVSYGQQTSLNTSAGFQRSGFNAVVQNLLKAAFPDPRRGGMICCIDNLELLQESDHAKHLLEALRDSLLQVHGLCWVLCGAQGITYGVAASPRLESFMTRPIEVKDMDKALAPRILESRIQAFSTRPNAYLPVLQSDFDDLYVILRGNLRTVLSYTDNYCQEVAFDPKLPKTEHEKRERFQIWLKAESEAAYLAAKRELTPKTLSVFDKATQDEGAFSPGDFEAYGFRTMANFRPYIKKLEDVSLVVSTKEDSDKRRKTIQITPKGWLVRHYQSLRGRAPVTRSKFPEDGTEG